MKSRHPINIFVLAALLCAAHSVQAQEAATAEAQAPTEASEAVKATEPAAEATEAAPAAEAAVAAPPEGKAHIVFFRPSKFVGSAIGFKVRENEVELGKLRNGNYFVLAFEPGAHAYVVHSEAKDVTNIEAEAGETYFLSASITMGVLAGRPNLSPSDASAVEAALGKLKKAPAL